jgi:Big-like domain-containing protein/glucodextranase-like protein
VSGVVTITASASDNVGVTRIDYMQDGQVLGVLSPPALAFSWNTAAASNGAHTLTARAYDAAGNAATSTPVAVTVSNQDLTAPTVTITTPTATPTYTASSSALTLGGTAADNIGVTQVTWANSRGGTGTATGTTSWTAGGIVLQSGANVLTVTARNAAGNIATRTMTVTYAAATAPTMTITTPTSTPTYSTSTSSLTLRGTASGDVTQVMWVNSRGGASIATGTTSWTASGIILQPGVNLLRVIARDAAGHTTTATVTVTYAP